VHSFQRMLDPANGPAPGDPARMAAAIIAGVDREPVPEDVGGGGHVLVDVLRIPAGAPARFVAEGGSPGVRWPSGAKMSDPTGPKALWIQLSAPMSNVIPSCGTDPVRARRRGPVACPR